ncbi:MAG: sel1 repeat family protein, partial [Hyphomicrobiales bacterium]
DDGVGRDDAKARDYMLKAAEGGFPMSAYYVGRTYYYGMGVEADAEKAEYWLGRAAQMGVPQGQFLYADMLLRRGQPELVDKALKYAESAGYGGEGMGFILLVDHYLELEQWDRAHGYATLALQLPDEHVQNLARKAFELTEPHIRRPPTAMDAGLG